MTSYQKLTLVLVILIIGGMIGYFVKPLLTPMESFKEKVTSSQRKQWMKEADLIRGKLASEGQYDCCLEEPCWYCLQKSPEHGEGASCHCAQDVLGGNHPCGECMGEILEGEGIAQLKPYFAKALADEVGEEHLSSLEKIINEVYSQ